MYVYIFGNSTRSSYMTNHRAEKKGLRSVAYLPQYKFFPQFTFRFHRLYLYVFTRLGLIELSQQIIVHVIRVFLVILVFLAVLR